MPAASSSSAAQTSIAEPVFDLRPRQESGFLEGTRTGDWLAMGDVQETPLSPTVPPPLPLTVASGPRRVFVRVVGALTIAATLFILVRVATNVTARQAILRWGSFGQNERIAAIVKR